MGDDNASRTMLSQAIDKAHMRDVTIYTMNASTDRIEVGHGPQQSDVALKRLAEARVDELFPR
jgi:hypothetical protein